MPRSSGAQEIPAPSAPETPADLAPLGAVIAHEDYAEVAVGAADLGGADASHARFVRSEFRGTHLTAATLRGLGLVDVAMIDCELSGADLHDASLTRVEFRNCRMTGINLSEAELRHVLLVDCKLDDTNARFARLDHVGAVGCSMVELDAYEASLTAVRFDGCDLVRADFSRTVISGFDLRGSKIDGLRGAAALRAVRIDATQVVPYALSVFAETGVRID